MNLKLWRIKRTIKRIDSLHRAKAKCKEYIKKYDEWLKIDKKKYKQQLKQLTLEESDQLFGELYYEKCKNNKG